MDPTAVNYNPDANTNTNTWCIAPVEGCMMPTYDIGCDTSRHPGATCHGAPEKVIGRYGLSSNFNAAATVNVPASCTFEVLGCTETTALNYDPRATVNFKCYTAKTGCLHPLALNFNCSTVGTSPCTDSVVVHSRSACTFYVPVINTRGVGATEMSWTLTTSGDAYRLGMDGMKDGVRNLTAAQIPDYDASQIEVTCVAGSAIWTVTMPNLAPYQYSELKLWSEQALATTATAQAYLEAAGAYDYIVLDISVSETYDIAFPPPSAPPEEELGLILGIVAGAIVGVLVVATLWAMYALSEGPGGKCYALVEPAAPLLGPLATLVEFLKYSVSGGASRAPEKTDLVQSKKRRPSAKKSVEKRLDELEEGEEDLSAPAQQKLQQLKTAVSKK